MTSSSVRSPDLVGRTLPRPASGRSSAAGAGSSVGPIRRNGPLPYYAQLADILRAEIAAARWQPGEALPSEAQLGSRHGLSRTAVRQALGQLVAEGLVQKEKGRGTFVRRAPVADFVVHEVRGFFDEMTEKGHQVSTRVLAQEAATAPPRVVGELGLLMGSKTVRVFRVRLVDGVAICEVETFLPFPRFEALLRSDLQNRSLYSVLASDFGTKPTGGHRYIESASAAQDTARNLGISRGEPLLKLTAINFDQSGVPFEYFLAHYRADATRFELTVTSKVG